MEVQIQNRRSDRISALPQDTIEKILTLMPIRDAVRTSILSKKWRYWWTGIPKLYFDDDLVSKTSDMEEEISKYKLGNAIFNVLLQHKGSISELYIWIFDTEIDNQMDQIILHLSSSKIINKFDFEISPISFYYKLPCSFFSLQGLEHLYLSRCEIELPLIYNGFSMLKSLSFCNVEITVNMLQRLLTRCPLLEEFTWTPANSTDLEFTECEFVKLFKCLPSIQVLNISEVYIEHLDAGSIPQKLPIPLPHLRILVLEVCFLELSTFLCLINSSPNLEKIKIDMCWDHDGHCLELKETSNNLPDIQDYWGLNLDHLKELEITTFHNHALEMEFVKLIMANSPVLKKARIVLSPCMSTDEEEEMRRDLLHIPFPRASPAASFTIERRKCWLHVKAN